MKKRSRNLLRGVSILIIVVAMYVCAAKYIYEPPADLEIRMEETMEWASPLFDDGINQNIELYTTERAKFQARVEKTPTVAGYILLRSADQLHEIAVLSEDEKEAFGEKNLKRGAELYWEQQTKLLADLNARVERGRLPDHFEVEILAHLVMNYEKLHGTKEFTKLEEWMKKQIRVYEWPRIFYFGVTTAARIT